jgi:hypothetical protein
MSKYTATLLFTVLLFASCRESDVVVITPLNTYTASYLNYRADALIRQQGMLPQQIRANERAWRNVVNEVIQEIIFADLRQIYAERISSIEKLEPCESEVRLKYETLLASQKNFFSERPDIVSAAINYPRDTILYFPAGLRWVRYFTVPFEPEIRGRAAIFLHERRIADYERLVENATADMEPRLNELRQKLQSGVSFDIVAEEYGGVTEVLLYNRNTRLFPAQFRALNALNNPGDIIEYNIFRGRVFMLFVREPVHIVVPFEEVRETLTSSLAASQVIMQHNQLMQELHEASIANRSVRVRPEGVNMVLYNRAGGN